MEAKTYVIDFGLNLDAGVERIGFPLSAGLVQVTDLETGDGQPAWFTQLAAGDQLAFRVWNHTVSGGKEAQIVCFRATWVDPARWNDLASPLHGRSTNPIVFSGGNQIHVIDRSEALSPVFTQARSGWIFGDPKTLPFGETFTVDDGGTSVGRYYLKVRLDVVIDESTVRTYHWDPEIVVGPRGSTPPPDDGQPAR